MKTNLLPNIEELQRQSIEKSGIYFLFQGNECVYVGSSKNVFVRISQHIQDAEKEFDSYSFLPCDEIDLKFFECSYIDLYKPKYNLRNRDINKTETTIRIEVPEEIHSKLTEAQEKLKSQGLNMSLASIVVKHLELTKDKIKTGYEK